MAPAVYHWRLGRAYRRPLEKRSIAMICPGRPSAPRLSIIVPVLGPPAQMEETLVSVLENRPAGCEVLVVLNQPYDDPYELADEVQFVEAPRGAGLAEAINSAIASTRAEIIHVLPCGVQATEGWCDKALAGFDDPKVAAVIPVLVDARDPSRIVSAGAVYGHSGRVRRLRESAERTDLVADPDHAAAFYRKSALERVGRFSSRFGDRLSPVDLGLTLQEAGYRSTLSPSCRMLTAEPLAGTQGGLARGWSAERLFWQWLPATGRGKWLLLHGLRMAALSVGAVVRPSRLLELLGATRHNHVL